LPGVKFFTIQNQVQGVAFSIQIERTRALSEIGEVIRYFDRPIIGSVSWLER